MNLLHHLLKEMAYSRESWQHLIRGILRGAFREFLCRQVAASIGKPDNWSIEVGNLLHELNKALDKNITKTTFKNTDMALKEVFSEVSIMYDRVTSAKNKIEKYYPKYWKQIRKLSFIPEEQFQIMIKEFVPKLEKYLHYNPA